MKRRKSTKIGKAPSLFALDIGTRSVVGMLGHLQERRLVIDHAAMVFHESRAMFDGQIHDIDKVAQVIQQVKQQLEKKSKQTLSEVTIAAAGRALKTVTLEWETQVDELQAVTQTQVHQLELEALQQAQATLQKELEEETRYFCVGHSVIHYAIDGAVVSNPAGHHGKRIKVHLIATFLPKMVVDSLYTAVSMAGLEVVYMTLEPIAAIEVAVPENARLLNIALVDVGAGTSDMAITRDGTIIAYGMSAVAGDEITELLAREEMLDFDGAEKLKCRLNGEQQHTYTDIFGFQQEKSSDELLSKIQPAIQVVAGEIAAGILEKNGKKPSAVFLIGGGSQIPQLPQALSQQLELPPERVAVRHIGQITDLEYKATLDLGPEGVTPIGILKKALVARQKDFFEVEVNGRQVRMFQTRRMAIKDALAAVQYDPQQLVPRRGEGMDVTVNGQPMRLYGEYGEAAVIYLNGQIANLESEIHQGDKIMIQGATSGKKRRATIRDILPSGMVCQVNGKEHSLIVKMELNHLPVNRWDISLNQGDAIGYETLYTVEDVCCYYQISGGAALLKVNGIPATGTTSLNAGDQVEINEKVEIKEEVTENAADKASDKAAGAAGAGKSTDKQPGETEALQGSAELVAGSTPQQWPAPDETTGMRFHIQYNGAPLTIETPKKALIFVDLFDYVDFDRSDVQGRLVLTHNGRPADYTANVRSGDEIWVYWDQESYAGSPGKKEPENETGNHTQNNR